MEGIPKGERRRKREEVTMFPSKNMHCEEEREERCSDEDEEEEREERCSDEDEEEEREERCSDEGEEEEREERCSDEHEEEERCEEEREERCSDDDEEEERCEEKRCSDEHEEEETCPPHFVVSKRGHYRSTMEDTATAIPDFLTFFDSSQPPMAMPLHFFAVYDGHAGFKAALHCEKHLHSALAESAKVASCDQRLGTRAWEEAINAAFHSMDEDLYPHAFINKRQDRVGTTAVIALLSCNQIAVANCGDSRAVLSRRGGKAVPLSIDHKPNREDEYQRIVNCGGRVVCRNATHRVMGILAMSRAIGDWFLKPYVIPDPEVMCVDRSTDDECLILASDGLWDVLSNEEVCEVACKTMVEARYSLRQKKNNSPPKGNAKNFPAAQAASVLTKLAMDQGSTDNVTVLVVDLNSN